MTSRTILLTLATSSFGLISCKDQDSSPAAMTKDVTLSEEVSYSTQNRTWEHQAFTSWMSRAELQFLQEKLASQQYFSRVEGRNHKDRLEYRAVVSDFTDPAFEQWAVFWGITEAELFDYELLLLKQGFERDNMQIFKDPSGQPLHQIVWLQPRSAVDQMQEQRRQEIAQREAELANRVADLPSQSDGDAAGEPIQEAVEQHLPATTPVRVTPPARPITTPAPAPDPEIVEAPDPPTPPAAAPQPAPPAPATAAEVHTVRSGDTLWKISRQSGVSVAQIKKLNGLRSDVLRVGQKLKLSQ